MKVGITSNGAYYGAGFGLGINNNNGAIQSMFYVQANTFAVLNGTGTAAGYSPFVITGGQVFINQAFIGAAYIDNARIADAAITYAKIGDAQIGWAKIANASISNAHIADAQIDNAKIADGSITYAKIGDAQIGGAKIWNAAIQTAHIGAAQIDTLRIGANAVSTIAAFGGNGTYYASGGTLVVTLYAQCGNAAGAAGNAYANVNGSQLSVNGSGGPQSASSCIVIGSPNGGIGVSIGTGGTTANVVVVIQEFKR